MKESKKSGKVIRTIIRLTLLVLCGAILGVNIYMANASKLVGNKLPTPFGYGAAVVLSGSMEPEFSKGDLIIVKEDTQYAERDIVVFQSIDSLIVHRIIEIDGETVTTQGDANDTADEPINVSLIKGKVLFHIPYAGNVVSFLKTPVGTVLVLIAAIALVEIPRRREKAADDAEKQKILDEIKRLKEEQEKELRENKEEKND